MASPALLVRISAGPGPGHALRVQGPFCIIGRSRSAGVRLLAPEVSGVHVRLSCREDGIWVEDLGSANGTTLEGAPLTPGVPVPLPPGGSAQVGPYCLTAAPAEPGLDSDPGAEGTATLAARLLSDLVSSGACPPATLQVTYPGGVQHRCVIPQGGTLRIGRDPSCDLGAADPDLSRSHAELRMEPSGAIFVDLGSKNGTYLGDTRLEGSRMLCSGDRLRLGGTEIVFEDPAEALLRELDGEDVPAPTEDGSGGAPPPGGAAAVTPGGSGEAPPPEGAMAVTPGGSGGAPPPEGAMAVTPDESEGGPPPGGASVPPPDLAAPAGAEAAAAATKQSKDARPGDASGRSTLGSRLLLVFALAVMAGAIWALGRLLL